MRHHLAAHWYDLQDTLWFIPAVMTVLAAVLAFFMVWIDQQLRIDRRVGLTWLFGGGAEGARGVLSAIASTMITVTGVIFSITIVALQLASGQFTPRVLRTFTGDRGNQIVLGIFISTFIYCLLVLRSVRSATEDKDAFVPSIAVTLAIALALVSIGFLIYYINHAARSIQASIIIDHTARDTLGLIDALFPADRQRPLAASPVWEPQASPIEIVADSGGYVQSVDHDALFNLAREESLRIHVRLDVGTFLLPGASIASVWPISRDADVVSGELHQVVEKSICNAFILGPERTMTMDVAFGFLQLSDIAVKALSPGINDPTTAKLCVDHLAEALVTLERRGPHPRIDYDEESKGTLVMPEPSFEQLVHVAFDQIRHYGAGDASVVVHLGTALGQIAALVSSEDRPCLVQAAHTLWEAASALPHVGEDMERIRAAVAWAG